jgi:hypothetical protein
LRDSNGKVIGVIRHVYEEHIRYAKFAPAPAGVTEAASDRLVGVWEGTLLTHEQTKTPMVIKISKRNGSYQAGLDLPGNGVQDMPFKTFVFLSQSSLFLACSAGDDWATFRATLNNAATEMSGIWTERQGPLPMTFKRSTPQIRKTK